MIAALMTLALLSVQEPAAGVPAPMQVPMPAVTLHAGDLVPLATIAAVSTKTAAVGDLVPMTVSEDVRIAGRTIIPRGTPAMGEVATMQAKGAFGQAGKLLVRPLYLTLGDRTVRLEGGSGARGTVPVGSVIGLIALSAGFTGRSAVIPAGTTIPAILLRDVTF